ncbi:alpha/beta hydrolase, partial [Riemerella anatipestifer]
GIVATEVAKHIAIEKVILIASAKTKFEIPKLYRWFGKLKIDRLISERFLRYPNVLLYWVFGVENNSDKILLSEIIKDTNPKFLKWAIREILHWRNVQVGDNTIHIHGTKDRILPYRNIDSPIKVNNGGHFMIINKSELLTQILKVEINKNLEV